MATLSTSEVSEIFGGIDFATEADFTPLPTNDVLCGKCKGTGKFFSYSGKAVGSCFSCTGSGLDRMVGVTVPEGACAKCAGSGEWRPGRPCFACNSTGKAPGPAADIKVEAIEKAFAAAVGNGIKIPRLRLGDFTFSLAPLTGKNAGSLYVKQGSEYIGKVTAGQFHARCDDATRALVIEAAADPHKAAVAHGAKTGKCSCCGAPLTKGVSIEKGIGPICEEKFGW